VDEVTGTNDLTVAMLGEPEAKAAAMNEAEDRKSLILSVITMMVSIPALIGA
tara:strand:- start:359 stop:514 length:156 start_codon:yes stop_codon:yes gene_type:complete